MINEIVNSHPIQITLKRMTNDGFKITTQLPEISPKVKAHKGQLIQVLLHLISNAEDAMPDKGELKISIGVVQKDNKNLTEIIVQDNGIGIPEENLQKI